MLHICSTIFCGRCNTAYCPRCYSGCPNCTRVIVSTTVSTKINADNIKEFYKLK